jgi:hypothetical protein
MVLTENQVSEILSTIERNVIIYGIDTVGADIVTEQDKELLEKFGIDPDKLKQDWPVFTQSFYFGRLTAALTDADAKKVTYQDFLKYLKKGQYAPLTERERNMLELSKLKTYGHIKGLGETIKQSVNQIIIQQDMFKRLDYENIIHDEIKLGIEQRKSKRSIMIEIGKKTGDWQRDLGRIVQTEYNNIFQDGRAAQILEKYGEDALCYKDVYEGACRHCIRLYLNAGIGSKPQVFKIKELIRNGNNMGIKPEFYKPIVGSTHVFCRCSLRQIFKGQIWDQEKQKFDYPEWKEKPKSKYFDTITVGDKVYYHYY